MLVGADADEGEADGVFVGVPRRRPGPRSGGAPAGAVVQREHERRRGGVGHRQHRATTDARPARAARWRCRAPRRRRAPRAARRCRRAGPRVGAAAQTLEVVDGQGAVGQAQRREQRAVGAEAAVGGQVRRARRRSSAPRTSVTVAASPRSTRAPGYGRRAAPTSASAPGRSGPGDQRHRGGGARRRRGGPGGATARRWA